MYQIDTINPLGYLTDIAYVTYVLPVKNQIRVTLFVLDIQRFQSLYNPSLESFEVTKVAHGFKLAITIKESLESGNVADLICDLRVKCACLRHYRS